MEPPLEQHLCAIPSQPFSGQPFLRISASSLTRRFCADGYVGSCYNEGPWLAFYNNTCITTGGGFSCPKTDTMSVYDNKVYAQSHATSCNGTVGVWPKDDTVHGWAAAMLQPFPMAVEL